MKYADKQQRMFDEEKLKAGQCVIGLQVLLFLSVAVMRSSLAAAVRHLKTAGRGIAATMLHACLLTLQVQHHLLVYGSLRFCAPYSDFYYEGVSSFYPDFLSSDTTYMSVSKVPSCALKPASFSVAD